MYTPIKPVEGAASFFATYDSDKGNRPAVFMKVLPEENAQLQESKFVLLRHFAEMKAAEEFANELQEKENDAALQKDNPCDE